MGGRTKYARSGDLHIAWQEWGEGPVDVLYVPATFSQVEMLGSEPTIAAFVEGICGFARMITFDRRGSGLSDPLPGVATLEEQMDDVLAVMDAAGSERAAVMGSLEGGPLSMLFAASHPDRTEALILYGTFARACWAEDYDWALTPEERNERTEWMIDHWGEGMLGAGLAPSRAGDPEFVEWMGRVERYSASPGMVPKINDFVGKTDVRHVLPSIRVPTLIMHRRGPSGPPPPSRRRYAGWASRSGPGCTPASAR